MPGFSTIFGVVYPLVALDPALNAYPAGRHLGAASLTAVDTDLLPSNIIYGITIFGVTGTHGYLDRWIPVTISSLKAAGIVIVNQSINKNAPQTAPSKQTTDDAVADLISRSLATVASVDAEAITAVNQLDDEPSPHHTHYDLKIVVGGAEADDGGALTDQTTAAQNATVNDMTLLPATPAENDAYYFGHDKVFDKMTLNIGTQGAGVWTIVWEFYHSDTTWHALADLVDDTTGFTNSPGNHDVSFTKDASWTTVAVNGVTKYWIRARVSAYTSKVTQPNGTQSWITITT
jgi:hypothetical protein